MYAVTCIPLWDESPICSRFLRFWHIHVCMQLQLLGLPQFIAACGVTRSNMQLQLSNCRESFNDVSAALGFVFQM